jgi:bacteriorhodopsin
MSRHLPTLRGWAALLIPLVGGLVYLAMLPMRFVESGVGTFISEPVSRSAWIVGGGLILLCVAACLEAFRRGSRTDRIVLCFAALLTFWLIHEFFAFMLLPVRPSPI